MSKSALLIDGANTYASAKMLGYFINFKLLLGYLEDHYDIVRANYYTAVRVLPEGEDDAMIPLIDWLQFNGFKVITKDAQVYRTETGTKTKGNVDVEIAVDAITMATTIDHFILCTGDGDFTYLVDTLQRMGRKVTVISTKETSPPMVASILRREADLFIDLRDIRKIIERTRKD